MPTPYATESDVYTFSGLSSALIQTVTGKSEAQVTSLITSMINKADSKIRQAVRVPLSVHREKHIADGEQRIFELGPHDEDMNINEYDPQSGVVEVFAVYLGSQHIRLPLPKDCDVYTENNHGSYGASNAVVSSVANTAASLNVGSYCIQAVFSASGYIEYPSSQDLNKIIAHKDYVTFILQTDDATATFTLRLYDADGNYREQEFTLLRANKRYFVSIQLGTMDGSVTWGENPLYYWRLYANKACTIKLDGFNFNEGFMWTYPYGEIIHTGTDTWTISEGDTGVLSEDERIYVTYSYDPFLAVTPEYIKSASARLAGAYLWDHLAGYTSADVKFQLQADSLTPIPERDVMLRQKERLIQEAKEDIAEFGYGFTSGVV